MVIFDQVNNQLGLANLKDSACGGSGAPTPQPTPTPVQAPTPVPVKLSLAHIPIQPIPTSAECRVSRPHAAAGGLRNARCVCILAHQQCMMFTSQIKT